MPNYQGNIDSFYAYVHARPDGSVFYVGKGSEKRARKFAGRNPHHRNIVAKHGKKNILVGKYDCSSEDTAFELERGLVSCFKRMGVSLVNRTDGGEGVSGIVISDAQRKLLSDKLRGIPKGSPSDETRAKISAANTGKKRSAEARAKMSKAAKGRKFSDQTRAKLSAAAKVFWAERKAKKENSHA